MGLFVVSDALTTVGGTQGLGHGISKYFLNWPQGCFTSNSSCSSSDQCDGTLRISAVNFPIEAVAKVISNRVGTLPRRNMKIKKRRRIKKKTVSGDDGGSQDCTGYGYEEVFDFFVGGGDSSSPVCNNQGGGGGVGNNQGGGGGGGGGGSGKGGNFGGFGGSAGDGFSSDNSFYHMAFYFVYEVLSWIVLTNCLHFAYKKVLGIRASRLAAKAKKV